MIEDKIEKIVNKYAYNEIHDPDGKFSVTSGWCYDKKLIKELSTLIQEERKDAVIGFAYYLLKRRNKDEFWGLSEGEVEMAMIVAKQYLESEGKE